MARNSKGWEDKHGRGSSERAHCASLGGMWTRGLTFKEELSEFLTSLDVLSAMQKDIGCNKGQHSNNLNVINNR